MKRANPCSLTAGPVGKTVDPRGGPELADGATKVGPEFHAVDAARVPSEHPQDKVIKCEGFSVRVKRCQRLPRFGSSPARNTTG